MQKSKGLDIEFKGKMKRGIFIFVLALVASLFALSLLPPAFAAKDFIVENRTSPLFVVNGTTGNIIMTPSFGLVGIGTLNPATVLDVKGKANFTGNFSIGQTSNIFFVDNTSSRVGIGISTPTTALEVEGSVNISGGLNVTAGDVLLATTSGNVGIRTTRPVAADGSARTFQIGSQSVIQDTVGYQTTIANNAYYDGAWKNIVTGYSQAIRFNGLGATGDMTFSTSPSVAAGSTLSNWDTSNIRMVILNSGNVGIGTTTPIAQLDVAGSGRFIGSLNASRINATNITSTGLYVDSGTLVVDSSNNNVGIGTTSPQNALDIVGAVTVSKGLNASNLNVTGFSITDDSLVTVVDFDEEIKEKGSQNLEIEPKVSSRLKDDEYQQLFKSFGSEEWKTVGWQNLEMRSRIKRVGSRLSGFKTSAEVDVPALPSTISIKKLKIKDIKAGQYVLSLDESTGKLVPRKVNALLDHGIKSIYEMTTEDGRAINTTAEHPYFIKSDTLPNKISRASDGVITLFGKDSFNPLSPDSILQPNLSDKATYGASFKCGAIDTASFALFSNDLNGIISTDLLMNSITSKISPLGSFDSETILSRLLGSSEYIYCVEMNSNLHNISFNSKTKRDLPLATSAENTTLKSTTSTIFYDTFLSSEYFTRAESKNLLDMDKLTSSASSFACFSVNLDLDTIDSILFISDNFSLNSSFKNLENNNCHIFPGISLPSTVSNSLLTSSGTLNSNSAISTSPAVNNENNYLKVSDENSLGEWIEVRYLKEGMEIAVPDYENCEIQNKEKQGSQNMQTAAETAAISRVSDTKHDSYINISVLDKAVLSQNYFPTVSFFTV